MTIVGGADGRAGMPQAPVVGRRTILRTEVDVQRRDDALLAICAAIAQGSPLRVAFVNAHLALLAARDRVVAAALSDALLLNDGVGLDIASRVLFGRGFPANLNGTDFVPALLDRLEPGCRIFLLGATAEVIAAAAAHYRRRWPQHRIVGHQHGFFSEGEALAVADRVGAARPDLVLVGLGCPRQELWLAANIPSAGPVGIGVGALFDFQTGRVRRAPHLVRRLRCEWIYRLLQEPRRLCGRYLVGNIAFLARVAHQRARQGRRA